MKYIADILERRSRGSKATVLVAVVKDTGSAPRGAGACMAVGDEGRLSGSIGGGALEHDAVSRAKKALKAGRGELVEYRLSKDEAAGLGMVCGGSVDVLLSYIPPDKASMEAITQLKRHISRNMACWLILPYEGGISFLGEEGFFGAPLHAAKSDITAVKLGVIEAEGKKYYIQRLINDSRVYVFGGGHLAQELVPLISRLGFRCVVTDDRAEFASKELFPDAEELHTRAFTELEGNYEIHEQDLIVIVTRGHIGDFEVQRFALKTPAYYIGAVGSRGKIAAVNAMLRSDGFTPEQIARVTAPIGISIKSETPAEIAVSIAAQLIERRALYNEGR